MAFDFKKEYKEFYMLKDKPAMKKRRMLNPYFEKYKIEVEIK